MEELKDKVCGACGKEFEEKDINSIDSIVYCPVCGTPVHRSCWEEKGGCPFEDKHAEGYVWGQEEEKKSYTVKTVSEIYSEEMRGEQGGLWGDAGDTDPDTDTDTDFPYSPNSEEDPAEQLRKFLENRSGERSNREKTYEEYGEKKYYGVSEREMMCFLNVDGPQRLYRLAMIKYMIVTGKKTNLNIFAGLLNPYNQFYKGMTFLGLLLTIFNYIMSLPQIIVYYMTFFKDKAAETAEAVMGGIDETALTSASNTLWFIQLIVVILLSVFGDYLYIAFMVKKIKKIRSRFENEQSEEYLAALADAGRPRLSLVALGFVLQAFLSLLTLLVFTKSGI
ncbi:MAG: hypothetical protein K2N36_01485 [Ruminiclostridium sp.]|nr:hypothetical protein [Ruminiclostridium sp.]